MKLAMKILWQLLIKKKKKNRELKESTRMMNSQRNDVEKINLTEEGKKKKILMRLLSAMKLVITV